MVAIRHVYPGAIQSTYANHILVNHTPQGEFQLSFFEIDHPILLGTPEERADQAEKIEAVDANCVARIVMTQERIEGLIQALGENYSNFKSNKSESEPEDSNIPQDKKHAI